MAAHDDKISNNRRRLFKALSTVPVVMTLRPGSALANSSAYQCVQNMPEPTHHYRPDDQAGHCATGDCYVYQPRSCWDCAKGRTTDHYEIHKGLLSDFLNKMIVETDDGEFIREDGFVVPTSGSGVTCTKYTPRSGGTFLKLKVNGDPCIRRIPTETGWFLAVGAADDPNTPRFFHYKGVYPKMRTSGTGQHGITASCMNSIPHDIRGEYRTLNGG